MKRLLIGLLVFGSFSSFAYTEICGVVKSVKFDNNGGFTALNYVSLEDGDEKRFVVLEGLIHAEPLSIAQINGIRVCVAGKINYRDVDNRYSTLEFK